MKSFKNARHAHVELGNKIPKTSRKGQSPQAPIRIKKIDVRDPFATNFDVYVKITQALYKQDSKRKRLERIIDRQNNLLKKFVSAEEMFWKQVHE